MLRLRRGHEPFDVEPVVSRGGSRCGKCVITEVRCTSEDPEILTVRITDDRPGVVRRQADDPVVSPDSRKKG